MTDFCISAKIIKQYTGGVYIAKSMKLAGYFIVTDDIYYKAANCLILIKKNQ